MADEKIVFPSARPQTLPAGPCEIAGSSYKILGVYPTQTFVSTGWDIIVSDVSTISQKEIHETDYGDVVQTELRFEVWEWAAENLGPFEEIGRGNYLIVQFASEEDAVTFMLRYG